MLSDRNPDARPQADQAFHPLLFYTLSIAIAWVAWAPLLLHTFRDVALPVPYPIALFICQTVGAFAPLLSLFLIQRIKGTPGLVDSTFRKVRVRGVPVYWFLLPAIIPVAIAVAAAVVHGALSPGSDIAILKPGPRNELGWSLILVIPFSFAMGMIGSPLGEEPGWRGYMFDRWAAHGHGVWGSTVVAVMWWIWHVPLFLVLGVSPNGYSFLELVGHSLLIDSVFLLSGRNLLVAMLYHQGVNTSFMFFATRTQTVYGLVVLLGVAITVRVLAEKSARPPFLRDTEQSASNENPPRGA